MPVQKLRKEKLIDLILTFENGAFLLEDIFVESLAWLLEIDMLLVMLKSFARLLSVFTHFFYMIFIPFVTLEYRRRKDLYEVEERTLFLFLAKQIEESIFNFLFVGK